MEDQHWKVIRSGNIQTDMDAQGLWENACKYFEWSDTHPIELEKKVGVGKDAGKELKTKVVRPYSIKALCMHCGILEEYLSDIRQSKDKTSDYFHVVSRIMYIIYTQNIEMAQVGVYSPVVTGAVLKLDKEAPPSTTVRVEVVQGIPALSNSENEILEKLELEKQELKNDSE